MHIPDRYYKRIPPFYFIVGVLLIANAFYMKLNHLAAYLYFIAGIASIVYAAVVYRARTKNRKVEPATDGHQSESN